MFRQKDFWSGYFDSKKEEIFTGVEVLIFVIDVESKGEDLDVYFFFYQMKILTKFKERIWFIQKYGRTFGKALSKSKSVYFDS